MIFDALVVAFVALAAGIGAWKGFAWQVGAIAAPVAGFAAGWPLSARFSGFFTLAAPLDRWAAFGVLYLIITLAVFLAALAARRGIRRAELGAWDRHLGFLAGAAKGFAAALILTAGALAVSPELRDRVRATTSGAVMARVVRAVRPVLPESLDPWLVPLLEPAAQRRNA